jgi:hypothetical protein
MRRRLLVASLLPVAAVVSSCLGPTEIVIHVTTNACGAPLTHVDFYIEGTNVPSTSASGCADPVSGDVGTLSIVPSGSIDARVKIGVVGALGGAACSNVSTADPGCIIARRELAFDPHTRLDLPIFLDSRCAGFVCADGTTCVADQTGPHCTGLTCDVDGGVACVGDAGGPDAIATDVISTDAITADVGPPVCKPIYNSSTPLFSWSFDTSTDPANVHEDHNIFQQVLEAKNLLVPGGYCGLYLTAGSPQTLAPSDSRFDTDTLIFSFAYQAIADGTILQLVSSGANSGFSIAISGGVLKVFFPFSQTGQSTPFTDSAKTNDGKWHTFVMNVLTNTPPDGGAQVTTATFARDGNPNVSPLVVNYVAAPGPLVAGPIAGIDQLEYRAP